MGEFFKGWRRQIGCVTLVLACVFAAWWVRSLNNSDRFLWRSSNFSYEEIKSVDHTLYWMTHRLSKDYDLPIDPMMRFETDHIPTSGRRRGDFHETNDQMNWYIGRCRFGIGLERDSRSEYPQTLRRVAPYWSTTVPLTLISAYLLLKKPRKSNQPKLVEPISVEGA